MTVQNSDVVLDRIYEIALEPSSLEDFIDFWNDSELSTQFHQAESINPGEFDKTYRTHLDRAQTILQRGEATRPDMRALLIPYDNLAAFVVTPSLHIEASNQGAFSAFGLKPGDRLNQLKLPAEMQTALVRSTQDLLRKSQDSEKLLKVEMATKSGSMLFRIMRIENQFDGGHVALIVSTHFYWRDSIGTLLGNVFHLTEAEQQVVRLLVEGLNTKLIAANRDTGEGTVRGQIKSVLAKMNLRSQTDIVRLVMTLGVFPKTAVNDEEPVDPALQQLSDNWLETEVWKPFKSLALRDGRTLTYHDMGPVNGNPILFSHMGSCMVRWSRSMIRCAYEHNLRIICPIRPGYGQSDSLDLNADPLDAACEDTVFLLKHLGISSLPYAVLGSDFPFAVSLKAKHPDVVTELLGIGGRPCLPGGQNVDGSGSWQRFFVSMAQRAPHMVQFASNAVMAMSRRIGAETMLQQLCKESPADLALLHCDEMKQILLANINMMASKTAQAGRAFAMEYIAFQTDWSDRVMATQSIPVQLFLAEEDPTVDLSALPALREAYPWIEITVIEGAGLALIYQKFDTLIPQMGDAAKRAVADKA